MSTLDDTTLPSKRCTKCKEEKPLTEFYSMADSKDGLQYWCKKCFCVYRAAYRAEHLEDIAAYDAEYYAEHREETRACNAAYAAEHPEERAANQRNRRARKKGNGGKHNAADVQVQYDRQKGKCFWCPEKVGDTYHVDHVVPLSKGGSNGPENIVIACPTCNLSKNAKHPMDFAGILF